VRFAEHFASELVALEPMRRDGLIEVGPDALRVSAPGRHFLRNLAAVFDPHLAARSRMRDRTYSQTH
jgi:oxygen-independent coproporphyrinogen III oxidase